MTEPLWALVGLTIAAAMLAACLMAAAWPLQTAI